MWNNKILNQIALKKNQRIVNNYKKIFQTVVKLKNKLKFNKLIKMKKKKQQMTFQKIWIIMSFKIAQKKNQ